MRVPTLLRAATLVSELAGDRRCAGCGRPGARLCSRCGTLYPGGDGEVMWAWPYGGAPRSLVLAVKLRGDRPAAQSLGDGVWKVLVERQIVVDAVTWVPGRPGATRLRGFDHAHAIAGQVARRAGLPLLPMLDRGLENRDQASLGREARRVNLRGVFVARASAPACVVVDDVVTTGATAGACMEALKSAGVSRVVVAAACGPRAACRESRSSV